MSGVLAALPFVVLYALFVLLVPVALLIALQVFLCRKSLKLGLILPALSLTVSLLLCLSVGAFAMVTGGNVVGGGSLLVTDESGTVIQEETIVPQDVSQPKITPATVALVAGVFLVGNIPTVIFGGIWLYHKNRRDWEDGLHRMRIQDLE